MGRWYRGGRDKGEVVVVVMVSHAKMQDELNTPKPEEPVHTVQPQAQYWQRVGSFPGHQTPAQVAMAQLITVSSMESITLSWPTPLTQALLGFGACQVGILPDTACTLHLQGGRKQGCEAWQNW